MWSTLWFVVALAQAPAPGADVTADVIQATAERMKTEGITDIPVRTIDAGGHNVGVAVIYRRAAKDIAGGAVHNEVTEVYHVLEGRGTLVTGGTVVNPKARELNPRRYELNGPGVSGTDIEGGVSRPIGPGDIIIIPAGTPHKFSEVEEAIIYTCIRFDPGQVMTLK